MTGSREGLVPACSVPFLYSAELRLPLHRIREAQHDLAGYVPTCRHQGMLHEMAAA